MLTNRLLWNIVLTVVLNVILTLLVYKAIGVTPLILGLIELFENFVIFSTQVTQLP